MFLPVSPCAHFRDSMNPPQTTFHWPWTYRCRTTQQKHPRFPWILVQKDCLQKTRVFNQKKLFIQNVNNNDMEERRKTGGKETQNPSRLNTILPCKSFLCPWHIICTHWLSFNIKATTPSYMWKMLASLWAEHPIWRSSFCTPCRKSRSHLGAGTGRWPGDVSRSKRPERKEKSLK